MPVAGTTSAYRPKPRDFRETYVRMGWDGIEDHFHANWRTIRRWIDEEGREDLARERAEFVSARFAERRKSRKRYVLGRTLTAVTSPAVKG